MTIGDLLSPFGLWLFVITVESARARCFEPALWLLNLGNATLGATALLAFISPLYPELSHQTLATIAMGGILIRMLTDRRVCPCHLTLWYALERLKLFWRYRIKGGKIPK